MWSVIQERKKMANMLIGFDVFCKQYVCTQKFYIYVFIFYISIPKCRHIVFICALKTVENYC